MTDFAQVVEDRGRNATRIILDAKERLVDDLLSEAEANELRAVIVDQVASVYRLAVRLLRNLEGQISDTANVNQLWLQAIAAELGITLPEEDLELARSSNGHQH